MTAPTYAALWPVLKIGVGVLLAVVLAEAACREIVRRSEARR